MNVESFSTYKENICSSLCKTFGGLLGHATAPRIDVWHPLVLTVLRRFDDFCTVIKPVACTARRSDFDPYFYMSFGILMNSLRFESEKFFVFLF